MIPKVVHYCWFGGGELPQLYKRCIESWHANLPGYTFIRWDESNTNFDTPFLKEAYKKKQWAFVSDYIRMRVLYENGGLYLDADVEVIKDFSPLLLLDKCGLGYESKDRPNSAVLFSPPAHEFLQKCMEMIDKRWLEKKPYLIAPEIAIAVCDSMPDKQSVLILPEEFFYPYNPYDPARLNSSLMYCDVVDNTYAIHHWAKGWSQPLFWRLVRKITKSLAKF